MLKQKQDNMPKLEKMAKRCGDKLSIVAVCATIFSTFLCGAAEYFVDRTGGSDSYDGTAAVWEGVGSTVGPKQSIQAAVDLADGNGTIITILPGVYDNGGGDTDTGSYPQQNRVVLKKSNITLRSSTGKASDVHIVGVRSTAEGNVHGMGDGSMRCLASNNNVIKCIAKDITFRDGCDNNSNSKNRGGGIYAHESNGITIIDCVVSNCAAPRGGGAHNIIAHSSVFMGNYASSSYGSALNQSRVANCLLVGNDGYSVMSYMSQVVNCTVGSNVNGTGRSSYLCYGVSGTTYFYNILSFRNGNNGCAAGTTYVYKSVIEGKSSVFGTEDEDTAFNIDPRSQFVSSAFYDFHPLSTGDCVGRGDGAYLLNVPMPEGYTYHDLDGVPVPTNGTVAVGAYQTVRTPAAARIDFEATIAVDGYDRTAISGDWLVPTNWPVTYRMKSLHANPYAMYFKEDAEKVGTKYRMRHSMYDGWTSITPSPDPSATNTLYVAVNNQTFYADANNGSDDYDGTAAVWEGGDSLVGPKKTLQAAVDLVTSSYGIIYAAPGVYDEGGMYYGNVSNRVVLTGHYIGLIASGGPGSATIVGAPDPDTGGLGPNAVRCVCTVNDYTFVQGFVLTGGYSSSTTGSKYRASAYWSNSSKTEHQILDCIVSNNVAQAGVTAGCTAYRTKFIDNVSPNYIMRDGQAVSSVFASNTVTVAGGVTVTGSSSKLYGCTLDCNGYGGVDEDVTCYGCAFLNRPGDDSLSVDDYGNAVCMEGCFVDAAALDYRLGALAPACAAVTPEILATGATYQMLTADIDGRAMPYSAAGTVDAGAVQYSPKSAMYAVVGDGGSAGILEGGPASKCITAPVTLTAVATGTRERPFIGFEVDGVVQPFVSTTQVLTASGEIGTGTFVKALYGTNWYVNASSGNDGDLGSTSETARRTLAAVAQYAKSGDVIHVAEGTYNEGEMRHDKAIASGEINIPSRVWVKDGVTLVADGDAERTFIVGAAATVTDRNDLDNGSNAVRCVCLGKNATIRGFTLTGGHTGSLLGEDGTTARIDDTAGGAVLGSQAGSSYVENCIITNNVAGWCGGGFYCTFRRCTIVNNKAQTRAAIGRQCSYYCCLMDGNYGSMQVDIFYAIDSCTIGSNSWNLAGTENSPSTLYNSSSAIVNSLILAPKISNSGAQITGSNSVFRAGCGVREDGLVNCIVTNLAAVAFDAGYRPKVGANVGIDRADDSLSRLDRIGGVGTDLSGAQGVMNGVRDLGAFEADWRPVYAADIGRRCIVESVSPEVYETENHTVFLPSGEIAGIRQSQGACTYKVSARVTGTGVLTFYEGDAVRATFTAGSAPEILFHSEVSSLNYRFAYTPGEGDEGGAEILGLDRICGSTFTIR